MALKAFYKQTGMEKNLTTSANELKRLYIDKNISKDWQTTSTSVYLIIVSIKEKRITYKWTF